MHLRRLAFYRDNARWLSTGLLLAFASGVGQTWYLSLFAANIREAHNLSHGGWGGLYMMATLLSAACLTYAGQWVDRMPVARLSMYLLLTLVVATYTFVKSGTLIIFFLSLFVLRFAGQGMLPHLAITSMGRHFSSNRGKAVAFAIFGFPVAEMVLPPLSVWALNYFTWQNTLLLLAVCMASFICPIVIWAMTKPRVPQGEGSADRFHGLQGKHWERRDVLKHALFWRLLPGVLSVPFVGTILFFQQSYISEVKGWPLQEMALGITLYAVTTLSMSLVSGWLIDRYGYLRLLSHYLWPLVLSLVILSVAVTITQWFIILFLCALSHGISSTLLGTIWPSLYGTKHLGAIRALITAVMVFATAAGPGITGFLIDLGIHLDQQALFMAVVLVCIIVMLGKAVKQLRVQALKPIESIQAD